LYITNITGFPVGFRILKYSALPLPTYCPDCRRTAVYIVCGSQ